MDRDPRMHPVGLLLVVVITLLLVAWNDGVERACEERGGEMVWERDFNRSEAYGTCVLLGTP